MITIPAPNFGHIVRMTDQRGTFEHAEFAVPRAEHGYCTDDMARVLVVATREVDPSAAVRRLAEIGLRFLADAQGIDGAYRNRMNRHGRWDDRGTLEDCWGRSLWGLGTAASHSPIDWVRQVASAQFERSVRRRSAWPRATAFAALGAAEMLVDQPGHRGARALLVDAADAMSALIEHAGLVGADAGWPWPERRLAYANAVIPEAMIAAGWALDRPRVLQDGLSLLGWLLDRETSTGHLSVTAASGAGPGERGPAFDQQPIEVATLADACTRAALVDDDQRWSAGVVACVQWFLGDNDGRHVMWNPATGGGFDGLHADGVNRNEGTESSLALLSTLQHARRFVMVAA